MDSLVEGVGASQVLTYVEGLAARGVHVRLHSFEKVAPPPQLEQRLSAQGVQWTPHPFGAPGPGAAVRRVVVGGRAVRGMPLVHARSDLAAASALLARSPQWLWDVRSLWADQRIALGALRAGSPEERVLRAVERAAARRSSAVVTLTKAVLPVLDARHGGVVSRKATVVPTCVDLDRFAPAVMPPNRTIELLLAGTINAYYDVPTMVRFVRAGQRRGRAVLRVLSPSATAWDDVLANVSAHRTSAVHSEVSGHLVRSHVGLSVCRADAGISLAAVMPTKVAEFLAVGRPVVVNAGLGDADRLVEAARAGIVLRDLSDRGLDAAWDALMALIHDPATPGRCRALAEQHFDVKQGVDRLLDVYAAITQRL
jgi:hypothetical protein